MIELSRHLDIEEVLTTGWQTFVPKYNGVVDEKAVTEKVEENVAQFGVGVAHGEYPLIMRLTPNRAKKNSKSYFDTDFETPRHTDMAWWIWKPAEIIVMGNVRQANEGGENYHVNVFDTFNRLTSEDQQLLVETKFRIPAAPHHALSHEMVVFESGEQGVLKAPMTIGSKGELLYARLNPNAEFFRINADQPPKALAALKKWNEANIAASESVLMQPGYISVVANDRAAHARRFFRGDRLQVRGYADRHPELVRPPR